MQAVTLYKKHRNSVGYWKVWVESPGTMYIEYATTINGRAQVQTEVIDEGKQGRTIYEQAVHRAESRISKQLDKGYKRSLEDAINNNDTDASGNQLPMLAMQINRVSSVSDDSYIQLKLNGHRMLVTKKNGILQARSRRGKPITTVDHILKGIEIPEGTTIDGELYKHGVPLQTIASWAKREQPNTKQLKFVVYDAILDAPFEERLRLLQSEDVVLGSNAQLLKSKHISTFKSDIYTVLDHAKRQGYEGLILRQNQFGYTSGRSNSLIKVKSAFDSEYVILDVVPSKDGWGVLVCKTDEGKIFKVSAPGTIHDKTKVLERKDMYIGNRVKVEYSELTKDGVPFHPVAIEFFVEI